MRVLSNDEHAAKLTRLCEIEGFPDEHMLFAAAISDSVCPAVCCNPENRTATTPTRWSRIRIAAGARHASAGLWSPRVCSAGSSDERRAVHLCALQIHSRE